MPGHGPALLEPAVNVHALQAPAADGAHLLAPPLDQVGALLDVNRRNLNTAHVALLDVPLDECRRQAVAETLSLSRSYHRQGGEPLPPWEGSQLLVSGHQPDLFHPGVWLKNFLLDRLAQKHRLVPVNVIIDNDTARHSWLRLPGDHGLASVPFDHHPGDLPFEERTVQDESTFAALPDRAQEQIRNWPFRPLLHDFWSAVMRQRERTPLLGERLAAARRSFEKRWGCCNLEVPLSHLAGSATFARFLGHLLLNLPQLHADYNGAVRAYRRKYDLHSTQHPAPDLDQKGDWLEAPLWAWQAGTRRRHHLWARRTGKVLQIRAGQEPLLELPAVSPTAFQACLHEVLLRKQVKIRTRALTTTLFLRLLLGDLMIHGLGGAKYDEVTDQIMADFFEVQPPGFLVATGTLRLPFPTHPGAREQWRQASWLRRDLRWNPQRHVLTGNAIDPRLTRIVQEKQQWIDRTPLTAQEKKARFEKLRALTAEIAKFPALLEPEPHVEKLANLASIEEVRQRRDYSLVWHPEEGLRAFLSEG